MLRQLGIVLMALAFVGFNGPSQAHKAEQAQNDRQPSAPVASASPVKQGNSSDLQPRPDQHVQADVWVVKSPEKDGYDKLSVWVNVTLALIGVVGLVIGIWNFDTLNRQANIMDKQARDAASSSAETLAAIKRQGDWMRQSAKAQMLSAKAAILGAKAASNQIRIMKSKERARLTVRFPPAEPRAGLVIDDVDQERTVQTLNVRIEITNEGMTGAFNVSATGAFLAVPIRDCCDTSSGFKLDIPTIIRTATPESPLVANIEPLEGDVASIPVDNWEAIQKGSMALHVFGTISYDDVFDDRWYTPFHFVWRVILCGEDEGDAEQEWKDISPAGGRVDRSRLNQSPNQDPPPVAQVI